MSADIQLPPQLPTWCAKDLADLLLTSDDDLEFARAAGIAAERAKDYVLSRTEEQLRELQAAVVPPWMFAQLELGQVTQTMIGYIMGHLLRFSPVRRLDPTRAGDPVDPERLAALADILGCVSIADHSPLVIATAAMDTCGETGALALTIENMIRAHYQA